MPLLDKAKIKKLIIEEIETVKSLINELVKVTKPISPENAIGRISRMDAINNKSINVASLTQSRIKLNKLEIALTKLNDKDFGLCIRCQQPIPLGRIMLMPHANKCVNCA